MSNENGLFVNPYNYYSGEQLATNYDFDDSIEFLDLNKEVGYGVHTGY